MGLFSFLFDTDNSGEKIQAWGTTFKCGSCGNNKFVEIQHLSGNRYDTITARCSKCEAYFSEDGPMHS